MKSHISKHIFFKPNSWAQDLDQQSRLKAFAESRGGDRDKSESTVAKTNNLETKRFWSGTDHLGGWIPTRIGQD